MGPQEKRPSPLKMYFPSPQHAVPQEPVAASSPTACGIHVVDTIRVAMRCPRTASRSACGSISRAAATLGGGCRWRLRLWTA